MSPVELLRSYYDDQREPDAAQVDAVRQRLQAHFEAETKRLQHRHAYTRRRVITAAGVSLAAVATGTFIVAGPRGAQSASATELLNRAAKRAAATSLALPGSVVQIRERYLLNEVGETGTLVVAERETVTLLRIPSGDEPWRRKRWESRYEYAFGDRSELPASMAVVDPDGSTGAAYESSRSGYFAYDSGTDLDELTLAESFQKIRDLPLDPDALLRALQADGRGPGAGSAQQVLRSATAVLDRGVASGELQAAMFQALQKVPDLAVVDEHATDIEGRTGVAIGLRRGAPDPTEGNVSVQLILKAATGQYLGCRFVSLRRDGFVPAGTQIEADAVVTNGRATLQDVMPPEGRKETVYP